MSETQVLFTKIAALRQHLEQVQGLARDAGSTAASLVKRENGEENGVRRLEREATDGAQQTVLLDRALRQLTAMLPAKDAAILPKQLTARARRVLEHGRELLGQFRSLADELEPPDLEGNGSAASGQSPEQNDTDPLVQRYRETAAMANTALRMIQAFPDAPSVQLQLCEGLEAILRVVAERVVGITAMVVQRRRDTAQVDALADLLSALHAQKPVNIQAFIGLAEQLLAEAQQATPMRLLYSGPEQPVRFIACHSLTVAQVMARVLRHDPEFRSEPLQPVLAALLHDAGMLAVPPEALAHAGPLDDTQRRAVEAHTRLGADLMTRLLPTGGWLAEAAAGHHEHLDGTGYPAGRREAQIAPLTRLLAVCDVYAALCAPRPHRPALDTRAALADTLLLAEQGALDRYHAERLLHLSFYPVGSVVELADGAFGIVVATHMGRRDLSTPARPVVALLTDTQGRCLPVPRHVDLAECEDRSILRTLPKAERRARLGGRYPELV